MGLLRNRTLLSLGALLLATAAVRTPFWLSYTHAYGHGDAAIWQVWSRAIHEHGFINVLRTADSNNIGYHYVLWPTSAIYALISPEFELWTPALRVLIKIPPFIGDLGLAALIFFVARSLAAARPQPRRDVAAAACAAAFALAPATVYDSMWWSQTDSVITICSFGAVVLLARGKVDLAWGLWMIGFLFKPQPIVFVPVLAGFTFWRYGLCASMRGAASAGGVGLAALAPFLLHGDARRIGETYDRMFERWPFDLSQGAWNGWSILDAHGDPHPTDVLLTAGPVDVTYEAFALGLCAIASLIALAYLRTHLDLPGLLMACAAMVFAFYMLPTSTHERYLYPAFAFAAPLLLRERWLIPAYAALAATFFLNLLAINPPNAGEFWRWERTDFAVMVAAVNLTAYAAFVAWMAIASSSLNNRVFATAPRGAGAAAPSD